MKSLMSIKVRYVHYMPKELESGVLYVSKEFSTAAHLCPCGCETKVRTPLGENDWKFEENTEGPSLYPSIGNWQQPCQSHYWIEGGAILWAESWTHDEVSILRERQSPSAVGKTSPVKSAGWSLRKVLDKFRRWLNRIEP